MIAPLDRRQSARIRFLWPVWFGYDPSGQLHRGQAVDLGESGLSFSTASDEAPRVGDHVLTRFSYPITGEGAFDMGEFQDWCRVVRVDEVSAGSRRVALDLGQRLECFSTAEEAEPALV